MTLLKRTLLLLMTTVLCHTQMMAQDKIVNPEISYAGSQRTMTIGGLAVNGIEGYEDYMLLSIGGLSVGQEIKMPGQEITDAVKRYWRHGLFSDVSIAADSIVGDKVYLHIYLKALPRVTTINYSGIKKSEREDMEQKLGLLKGAQINPNMIARAKVWAKKYFDDKGFKNAEINIRQRTDVTQKNSVIIDIDIDKKEKM
ncbi:MAG: outer membrane protein assembly factor BamA, partial [Prevotella sp.]|nr:outer membrane protein assembly factor BamA [Prevotella sp.]